MVQRANGEGSVSRRRDGRYEIAIVDPATGKRHRAYAKTIAQARAKLKEMVQRAEVGRPVLDTRITVSRYAEVWLEGRAGRRRRASTVREYKWRLGKYVLPAIGGVPLRDLRVPHVDALLDDLVAQGLAPSTIKAVRNALAGMLKDAVRDRDLAANVATLASLPEQPGGPRRAIPTTEDVRSLLEEASGNEIEGLVQVLACTGARVGEALAMSWADVDLEAGTWTVTRTTTRSRSGAVVIGDRTKTGESRIVPLAPDVVEVLRNQRRVVARMKMAARLWEDLDLVFPSTVGTPQDPNNVRKVLRPLAVRAGFPGSFHGLRHHFASLAVTDAPDVTVAKILGHARTATTTDLYAHLRDGDARRIAVAVSVAVNAGRQHQ